MIRSCKPTNRYEKKNFGRKKFFFFQFQGSWQIVSGMMDRIRVHRETSFRDFVASVENSNPNSPREISIFPPSKNSSPRSNVEDDNPLKGLMVLKEDEEDGDLIRKLSQQNPLNGAPSSPKELNLNIDNKAMNVNSGISPMNKDMKDNFTFDFNFGQGTKNGNQSTPSVLQSNAIGASVSSPLTTTTNKSDLNSVNNNTSNSSSNMWEDDFMGAISNLNSLPTIAPKNSTTRGSNVPPLDLNKLVEGMTPINTAAPSIPAINTPFNNNPPLSSTHNSSNSNSSGNFWEAFSSNPPANNTTSAFVNLSSSANTSASINSNSHLNPVNNQNNTEDLSWVERYQSPKIASNKTTKTETKVISNNTTVNDGSSPAFLFPPSTSTAETTSEWGSEIDWNSASSSNNFSNPVSHNGSSFSPNGFGTIGGPLLPPPPVANAPIMMGTPSVSPNLGYFGTTPATSNKNQGSLLDF
jgi:hypothetical protein